jgi:hypothetical protein
MNSLAAWVLYYSTAFVFIWAALAMLEPLLRH